MSEPSRPCSFPGDIVMIVYVILRSIELPERRDVLRIGADCPSTFEIQSTADPDL